MFRRHLIPAVSVAQRKYFGWLEHSPDASAERKASGMSHQQLHDFAATKDKGLPQHVPHRADGHAADHKDNLMATNTTFQQNERTGKGGDWMEKAHAVPHLADGQLSDAFKKNKGGLHRATGTPAGKPIPVYRVKKMAAAGTPHQKHMAQAAENMNPGRYGK